MFKPKHVLNYNYLCIKESAPEGNGDSVCGSQTLKV